MEKAIEQLIKYNFKYINIPNQNSLIKIYLLFVNNILFSPSTSEEYYYLGIYYSKKFEFDLMKTYYLKAIELGNDTAMVNLADYYRHFENNYNKMKKYYLMAIKKDNMDAMIELGTFYENYHSKIDKAKKYYLMAAEKNNVRALYCLGMLYQGIDINYDLMKKYYKLAIKYGSGSASYVLINHYKLHNMFLDLLELYIDYPHITNITETNNLIKQIISDNFNKANQKKFTELLITHNKSTNTSLLLICSKNRMII